MDKAITTPPTSTSSYDQIHDFMNVDSFSQLPFIRPSPSTTKDYKSTSGLRLFGIDFSSSSATTTATDNFDSVDSIQNITSQDTQDKDSNSNNNNNNNNNSCTENGESGRKFECHYCRRNFPTSQALGGHQNAHKRERQHAKRAHLQSAMMAADPHHLYNLVNYTTHRPTNSYYPSSLTNTTRFSSYHPTSNTSSSNFSNHPPPTINGSPLMWRIPPSVHSHHMRGVHRDRSLHPSPYFGGSSPSSPINIDSSATKASMSVSMNMSSSQSQVGRRGSTDHVSLDLHL